MSFDISNSVAMSVEESFSEDREGSHGFFEPVAKRTRSASKKLLETPKIEDYSLKGPTILDVLIEDCWRIVFDYVKLQDLVLSERVSQHWRGVVLRYLQGIRLDLTIKPIVREKIFSKYRMLALPSKRFQRAIAKFGRAIVTADCSSESAFKALSKHSPNIEEIKIHEGYFVSHDFNNKSVPFNNLRQITIDVYTFDDQDIGKFLVYPTLEELVVNETYQVTGICLRKLRTKLKTLRIESCYNLKISNLISVSDRLTELTKLELSYNPTLENLHKLIDRTRKLEYLGLRSYEAAYRTQFDGLVDAICRLSMLKHLNLFNNANVDDKWLEAVGRCCKTLQTVSVGYCRGVTGVGVVALCRGAGRTLTALDACYNRSVTAEDVITCISYCPKLEILNVRHNPLVARDVASVVAALRACAARARPLRLQLYKRSAYALDDSCDFEDLDDLDDSGDFDDSDYLNDFDVSEDEESIEPPMEVSADLILDYNRNIFMCGDYALDTDWEHEAAVM